MLLLTGLLLDPLGDGTVLVGAAFATGLAAGCAFITGLATGLAAALGFATGLALATTLALVAGFAGAFFTAGLAAGLAAALGFTAAGFAALPVFFCGLAALDFAGILFAPVLGCESAS
ncbi:MAG: hypothetical protein U1F12_03415 [Pseudomonadales bacterium]